MQITISVRRDTLTAETSKKMEAKIEKLQRFYDRISSVEITVSKEGTPDGTLNMLAKVEPKKELMVQVPCWDVTTALDEALKKMEQQLKKFKEKLTDNRPE